MNDLQLIRDYFKRRSMGISEFGLFEFGIYKSRFDCFLANPHTMKFRGFEFKVNRVDFLNEIRTGKWKNYLKYCNTFSFVCPPELIAPEEIDAGIGLLWITSIGKHYGYGNRRDIPYPIWQKRPRPLPPITQERFNEIILLLIGRIKYRKEDFIL